MSKVRAVIFVLNLKLCTALIGQANANQRRESNVYLQAHQREWMNNAKCDAFVYTEEAYQVPNFSCWGYEKSCTEDKSRRYDICHFNDDKERKYLVDWLWNDVDFGYVRKTRASMTEICSSERQSDSSLKCTHRCTYCHGNRLFMDLTRKPFLDEMEAFKLDFFQVGEIGGKCRMNYPDLTKFKPNVPEKAFYQIGQLFSWYAELQNYRSLSFVPDANSDQCDVKFEETVMLVKLDATLGNFYHSFIDIINMYVTKHLAGIVTSDVQIILWDTSSRERYKNYYPEIWSMFTNKTIHRLSDHKGKRVCFQDVIFSLLPRFGNERFRINSLHPQISNCLGSSIIDAFKRHLLSTLRIKQYCSPKLPIKVTLLSRRDAQVRRTLNEEVLLRKAQSVPDVDIELVTFQKGTSIRDQITKIRNSDVLIGMHGAGLTHAVNLPDWGVLFELYQPTKCIWVLATMAGAKYFTWKNDSLVWRQSGDYEFDPDEFLSIFLEIVQYVKVHKKPICMR